MVKADQGCHLLLVSKTPSWPSRELRSPREATTDSEKIRFLLTSVKGEVGAWNGRAGNMEMEDLLSQDFTDTS